MPSFFEVLRANIAYAFIAVGAAWLLVAFFAGPLVLWPVVTCIAAGLLLRMQPGTRLTWAWATSSAVLGLLLSVYAAYANAPLISGPFTTIASLSLAGFSLFAVVHLFLLYAGYSGKKQAA